MYTIFTCLYFKLTAAILACHSLPHLTLPYMVYDVTALCMTTPLATLSACSQRPNPRKYSMLYCSMTTPLPTLSACSQRSYPRKYSILYSSTSPPQMAYIYLLSFPHRLRYRPFPFSLPLHSLTYITRQKPAWLPVALRPGRGCMQCNPLFGERPSQKYIRWAFPYPPAQNTYGGGAPFPIATYGHLPIPYLGEAVEP